MTTVEHLHHVVAGEERLLLFEQVAEVVGGMARACGSRAGVVPGAELDPLAAVQRDVGREAACPAIRGWSRTQAVHAARRCAP